MPTIAIDIRVLGTARVSGVEEYTEQLLAHLIPLRSDVQYTLFYAGPTPEHRPWMDAPNVTLVRVARSNRLLWLRTILTGRPYLDELVGGADVCFFPHFLLGAVSPACRRVITCHDLSFERMPELFSWRRRFWHYFQMRPRWQAQHAHHILAVSKSTKDDLGQLYDIPDERVTIIPSGIDTALAPVPASATALFRKQYQLPDRFLLMLGTLEPRKNIPAVVAAFERIADEEPDLHLVLAGSYGWLWRPIVRRIQSSPVADRIHLLGPVGRADRATLLSAAEMLLYPSLLEGYGFPPLEALQCGTPVIAGANSSLFETVGHASLLINPYSVDACVTAIQTLLHDSEVRTRLLAAYRQKPAPTWSEAAQATLKMLLDAADH